MLDEADLVYLLAMKELDGQLKAVAKIPSTSKNEYAEPTRTISSSRELSLW